MSFRDRRRNVNPLVHTSGQGILEKVNFTGEPTVKKVKTVLTAGNITASVFWDSQDLRRRPGRTKGSQGSTIPNYWADSTMNCSKKHDNAPRQIGWIKLRIAAAERVTRRAQTWVHWGGYYRHGGLLCKPSENVFFRRVKKVGTSLGWYLADLRPR